jgi:hypothetical protein
MTRQTTKEIAAARAMVEERYAKEAEKPTWHPVALVRGEEGDHLSVLRAEDGEDGETKSYFPAGHPSVLTKEEARLIAELLRRPDDPDAFDDAYWLFCRLRDWAEEER